MQKGYYRYHTIEVPLFHGSSLHVCVGHNLNEVYQQSKIQGDPLKGWEPERWGAIAFETDRGDEHGVFVFLRPDAIAKVIAHEAVHLTNFIFNHAGMRLDSRNDETQAYLLGWIVEQIYYALNSGKIRPRKSITLK